MKNLTVRYIYGTIGGQSNGILIGSRNILNKKYRFLPYNVKIYQFFQVIIVNY